MIYVLLTLGLMAALALLAFPYYTLIKQFEQAQTPSEPVGDPTILVLDGRIKMRLYPEDRRVRIHTGKAPAASFPLENVLLLRDPFMDHVLEDGATKMWSEPRGADGTMYLWVKAPDGGSTLAQCHPDAFDGWVRLVSEKEGAAQ